MADLHLSKKPFLKTGLFGVATAALYATLFVNTDVIMKYFTLGGWYATLPIATVFLSSYVHGSFSNYLWTALGIEAPKKAVQPQPTAAKRPVRRQRPRPRLTLNV